MANHLPFAAFWGITQGGPLSSLMFSVCVDAVIREWHCRVIHKEAAGGVFSEAIREIFAFFGDDGLVGGSCLAAERYCRRPIIPIQYKGIFGTPNQGQTLYV